MILVDTSVWVDHFRKRNDDLAVLLSDGNVLSHPFIIGEIACGNLKHRNDVITYLSALPRTSSAATDEVLILIENKKLMGKGIGWIDAHLLCSSLISNARIWTRDKNLAEVAESLKVLFKN